MNVFDVKQPTYKQITGIINKLKSSESPCPHDQISNVILKRYPILSCFIQKIMSHCCGEWAFLSCWKRAFTERVWYTKSVPIWNLRTSVQWHFNLLLKIYLSLIWNKIYSFLLVNQFIESNIQKGFWRAISGTIEYTELFTNIFKHAKIPPKKQKTKKAAPDNHYTTGSKKCIWRGRP